MSASETATMANEVEATKSIKLHQAETLVYEAESLLQVAAAELGALTLEGMSEDQADVISRSLVLLQVTRDRVSDGRLALGWA